MVDPSLLVALAVGLATPLATVVVAVINRKTQKTIEETQRTIARKEADDKAYRERKEAEEKMRNEMEALRDDALWASLEASQINLIKIQDGHLNGNVEAALSKVEKVMERFSEKRSEALSKLL